MEMQFLDAKKIDRKGSDLALWCPWMSGIEHILQERSFARGVAVQSHGSSVRIGRTSVQCEMALELRPWVETDLG